VGDLATLARRASEGLRWRVGLVCRQIAYGNLAYELEGDPLMNRPQFAEKLLLADGRLTELETALLKRAILDDNKVDREEVEFLVELKREATRVHPDFDAFLFQVLRSVVLADGVISDAEARWLRKILFADNQIVRAETKFVEELRREAKQYGKEFEQLWKDCSQLQGSELLG
jgi:uncharacterized tellurite resistance protein B-like protein